MVEDMECTLCCRYYLTLGPVSRFFTYFYVQIQIFNDNSPKSFSVSLYIQMQGQRFEVRR